MGLAVLLPGTAAAQPRGRRAASQPATSQLTPAARARTTALAKSLDFPSADWLADDQLLAQVKAGLGRARQEALIQAAAGAARARARRRAARLAAAAKARAARLASAAQPASQQAASQAAPAGSPQQIAQAMLASYGWSADQFSCLNVLWSRESGWNVYASNPGSGAYGIPQALPGSKMASAGPDWQSDAATQIRWGLDYIQGSYGSPCGAWDHEQAYGWY